MSTQKDFIQAPQPTTEAILEAQRSTARFEFLPSHCSAMRVSISPLVDQDLDRSRHGGYEQKYSSQMRGRAVLTTDALVST